MAINSVDRFGAPLSYAPIDGASRRRALNEVGPTERSDVDPRPVAPVEPRTAAAPAPVESLTSSARAATVAPAAIPRDTTENVVAARDASNQAEDAALAALADPRETPSAREVAQNFVAVAALVPSPQQLANDGFEQSVRSGRNVDASGAVAGARAGQDQQIGSRLSRFA